MTTRARRIIAAGYLVLSAPAWAQDPYGGMADAVGTASRQGGVSRVAVLPFTAAGAADKEGGVTLSERLVEALLKAGDVTVVERDGLPSVLAEQRLGSRGVVDPRQAAALGRILGAEAVLTGTFVGLPGGRVEVHSRLIDTATARVLGASSMRVRKEWETGLMPVGALWNVEPPHDEGFPAPVVRLVPDPFRGAPCAGWEAEVDRLQEATVGLKARYWARRLLAPGFDARAVTRNPGSEIRSLKLRRRFYASVRTAYDEEAPMLTPAERDSLAAADAAAEGLLERCQ
ncbi:hypothetical protein EPO15_09120 [bacterium]|nr:MAG: hypothetical protein EPO15_09120 [bacterium]